MVSPVLWRRHVSARAQLLLQIADDELILGWRDSEWTGIAPTLEEDVAFSSIAQNEIGHARAAYEQATSSDRKSTRLNSSHLGISYAVFCLKKKKAGLVTCMWLMKS